MAAFARFDVRPFAAASIGQVHRATTQDGRELAIKVQYPGVRASIDSDIDNVATLLRLPGLLPREMDLGPLLAEAKRQLHAEADYVAEARHLARVRQTCSPGPTRSCCPSCADLQHAAGAGHELRGQRADRHAGGRAAGAAGPGGRAI